MNLFDCADLPKTAENNSTVTVLAVVLSCIVVFLTVIVAIVIVICFVFKKKSKRKMLDLQEHVYDSVSMPALSTHTFVSKSTNLADYDDVKKSSDSKFELSDNIAYGSYKPLSAAETTPNTDLESTAADL